MTEIRERLQKRLETVLQQASLTLEMIGGGRNSRVYRVAGPENRRWALKEYFNHPDDPRDRLGTEFQSLQFLWGQGFRNVPQPIHIDREGRWALYEFIEGHPIDMAHVGEAEIDAVIDFLSRLRDCRQHPAAQALPPASEACFSGHAIATQLEKRSHRLRTYAPPFIQTFVADEFSLVRNTVLAWSRSRMDFESELPASKRTLSPSDFGFHNALLRAPHDWVFFDFEYFGWDDPAKMISDFVLHPGMSLREDLKRRFIDRMLYKFEDYPELKGRLEGVLPLWGLKWCLIMLNEFLPEHMERRQFAGVTHPSDLQEKQLIRARGMLRWIAQNYERLPYTR